MSSLCPRRLFFINLNFFVLQILQIPEIAKRLFLVVIVVSAFVPVRVLHFTQYKSINIITDIMDIIDFSARKINNQLSIMKCYQILFEGLLSAHQEVAKHSCYLL